MTILISPICPKICGRVVSNSRGHGAISVEGMPPGLSRLVLGSSLTKATPLDRGSRVTGCCRAGDQMVCGPEHQTNSPEFVALGDARWCQLQNAAGQFGRLWRPPLDAQVARLRRAIGVIRPSWLQK